MLAQSLLLEMLGSHKAGRVTADPAGARELLTPLDASPAKPSFKVALRAKGTKSKAAGAASENHQG